MSFYFFPLADDINRQPAVPDAPSAVEVDYNFDEVTDKCDKEECPPTNCASPYIPLGECCPVCPPQETIQPSYEERRGSTQGSGRPGAPGAEGRPGSAGRPGAPGPPGPQPDIAPLLGQINQQGGEKGPSPDPFSYMQAQVGPVGPRGSPGINFFLVCDFHQKFYPIIICKELTFFTDEN